MIRNGIGNIRNDAARRQLEVAAGVRREELNNQAAAMGQNMMAQAETLPAPPSNIGGILASSPELQQTAMAMANGDPVQRFQQGGGILSAQQALSRLVNLGGLPKSTAARLVNIQADAGNVLSSTDFDQFGLADETERFIPLPNVGRAGRPDRLSAQRKDFEQFGLADETQGPYDRPAIFTNLERALNPSRRDEYDTLITSNLPKGDVVTVIDPKAEAEADESTTAPLSESSDKSILERARQIDRDLTARVPFLQDVKKYVGDPTRQALGEASRAIYGGGRGALEYFTGVDLPTLEELDNRRTAQTNNISPDDAIAAERGNVSVIDTKAVAEAGETTKAIPQARSIISGNDATKIAEKIRNESEDPIDPYFAPGADPNEIKQKRRDDAKTKVVTEARKNASRKEKGEAVARAATDFLDLNRKDLISDSSLNKSILSALGVETGKKMTPEEEVNKNMELYKKIFKEDPGKDKTIDGYNLAFLGFAIASGRSPNALSNIADGLLKGVKKFNDTEEKRQARERKAKEFGLQKFLKDDEARKKFAQDFQLQERKLQARFAGIFSNERIAIAQMVTRAGNIRDQIASQEKIANNRRESAENIAAARNKITKLQVQLQGTPSSVRFADAVIGRLYPELEKGTDEHGSKFSELVNQHLDGKSLKRTNLKTLVFNAINDPSKKAQFIAAYKKQNPGVKTVGDKDLAPFIADQIRSIFEASSGGSTPRPTTGTPSFVYDDKTGTLK
tara:strand:- start:10992 stop:13202 length:2211 start_codon:yes stop_codon:yes gene_type:complete